MDGPELVVSTEVMKHLGFSIPAALFFSTAVFWAIMLFSPEAQVSGSAGFAVLEENVLYSYQETARRKLRPEEYNDYFQGRREEMLAAIQQVQPQFFQWRKAVSASGIKLKPVPVFAELDGERMIRVELRGQRGTTELTMALDGSYKAGDQDQLTEKLKELSKTIEFETLAKKWSEAESVPYKSAAFIGGLMEVRSFEKFTIAMAINSTIRKELQPVVQKELSVRLDKVAEKISSPFSELVQKGEMWIDPKNLISYKERFESLPSGEELLNPAASKFNFFGPLFDKHGGRTSKRFGLVAISMLFLSKDKNWEEDTKFGKNRGQFENWFGRVLEND